MWPLSRACMMIRPVIIRLDPVAEASSSGDVWTIVLSVATGLLALATIGLAAATYWLVRVGRETARTAVDELMTSRATLATALSELKHSQDATREDHKRRRGEATVAAVRVFNEESRKHHGALLGIARAKTAKAREANEHAAPTEIKDLTRANRTPEVIIQLRFWLDELEMLAVGARYGLYDPRVVHRSSKTMIKFLWDHASTFVLDFRQGALEDRRAPQPTAYENAQWLLAQFPQLEGDLPPDLLDGALPLSD
jgi:hypothetical protein